MLRENILSEAKIATEVSTNVTASRVRGGLFTLSEINLYKTNKKRQGRNCKIAVDDRKIKGICLREREISSAATERN